MKETYKHWYRRCDGVMVECDVTLTIKVERVVELLMRKALRNAGMKSSVMGGAVRLSVRPNHPENAKEVA